MHQIRFFWQAKGNSLLDEHMGVVCQRTINKTPIGMITWIHLQNIDMEPSLPTWRHLQNAWSTNLQTNREFLCCWTNSYGTFAIDFLVTFEILNICCFGIALRLQWNCVHAVALPHVVHFAWALKSKLKKISCLWFGVLWKLNLTKSLMGHRAIDGRGEALAVKPNHRI